MWHVGDVDLYFFHSRVTHCTSPALVVVVLMVWLEIHIGCICINITRSMGILPHVIIILFFKSLYYYSSHQTFTLIMLLFSYFLFF